MLFDEIRCTDKSTYSRVICHCTVLGGKSEFIDKIYPSFVIFFPPLFCLNDSKFIDRLILKHIILLYYFLKTLCKSDEAIRRSKIAPEGKIRAYRMYTSISDNS